MIRSPRAYRLLLLVLALALALSCAASLGFGAAPVPLPRVLEILAQRLFDLQPARVALLGTGTVGSAVWARLLGWAGTPHGERLSLVHVANSRFAISNRNGVPADTHELLLRNAPRDSSLWRRGIQRQGSR